jgi:GNAT superfamily N-acetyltransferase
MNVSLIERAPTANEYIDLVERVGWRPRDRSAVEIALANSLYAVCAAIDDEVVGCGRVIGDGALHLYLTDVIVRPEWQGRGIGGRIVVALTGFVDAVPYRNTLVAVLPTRGLQGFYERHGYKAQGPESPAMQRWVNARPD